VGDPIAEIETEKALVEYSAEEAGVVGRLVLAAGEVGEIGEPIAVLVHGGGTDADIDAALGAGGPKGHQPAPAAGAARAPLFASPIVRKIALEKGIDLAAVPGTGPNGRIVRRDLERLAGQRPGPGPATAPAPAPAAALAQAGDRLIPHTPTRRAIARRL